MENVIEPENYVCTDLLVKLASRCNINCSYCYWFKDPSVYDLPAIMTESVEEALCTQLKAHINTYHLKTFLIGFHGGEPMLFGLKRFRRFMNKLSEIAIQTNCRIRYSIMTNGILITEEWINFFKEFQIGVGISLDGPRKFNDANRIDFKGNGTYDRITEKIRLLQTNGIEPGIISVFSTALNGMEIIDFFVEQVGVKQFDVLIPDATYRDTVQPIAVFYKDLFDDWYDSHANSGVTIRIISSMVKGLLGGQSNSITLGLGAITTVTISTDGSIEGLDVMRVLGKGAVTSSLNIQTDPIQAVQGNDLWSKIRSASLNVNARCKKCEFLNACGGGPIVSRWSAENEFDNASIYCDDLKEIFGHVWKRLKEDIYV
ncbi:radical SAM protein [Dyadobacter sp. Leaf189]|uniref:radical SAM protein n=1 Tax=Dyadobacter sp. Leaf189 TaxID=1736295 RepID=UPI0006F72793|nr:radical SAM protein [Dyadobacter sp. Leaf189]KQS27068.1 hypothetical protein ASG33_21280 [Dyadobacter sp. Leaf189]